VFLVERLQLDWMSSRLGYQLLFGAVFGAFFLVFLFIITQDLWLSVKVGVFGGFVTGIFSGDGEIETKETLGWSWQRFRREGWKQALLVGLGGSLFVGLLFGLLSLFINTAFGLLGGLLGGLLVGLLLDLLSAGLENQIPTRTSQVNQGIVASFHNMWRFGTPFGVLTGIVLWIGLTTAGFWEATVSSLLVWLFGGGLGGFLVLGGGAVVEHFALRIMLWLEGYTPFNFVGFLDSAARLILLRKVGGGYIFVHRLLLEHLAEKKL